jgi:RNA polymerase sigma factor (sigma-70 family)
MRKRDPKHEASLNTLIQLLPEHIHRLLLINDHHNSEYIASEVLASLVRARYGVQSDLLGLITRALHRRVIIGIHACIRRNETLRTLAIDNSELVQDTASYFWEKFFEDEQLVPNSEVRFGVYLQDRVIDYMRHLLTEENTRESMDTFTSIDEEGNSSSYIDTVPDDLNDSPEINVMRLQDQSRLMSALVNLPQKERNAFYFRVECKYDWVKVAELLGCSIPKARDLLNLSIEKLQGALK